MFSKAQARKDLVKALGHKQCADCRSGEHDNYDDLVILVYVKDPDTGKIIKRAYLCASHREMYQDDGYEVKAC